MANDWTEKSPAFQWYARDWLTDVNLRMCSRAARGLWVDALSLMWLSDVQGRLNCISRADLCLVLGGTEAELTPLIDELISKGVASSDGPGSLISRRMSSMAKLKQTRSKAGSKGASKRWSNQGVETVIISDAPDVCHSKTDSKPEAEPLANGWQNMALSSATASADPKINLSDQRDPTDKKGGSGGGAARSPVWPGCVYFRMSDSELILAQDYYRKEGLPLELIPHVITEVEQWLTGPDGKPTPKAMTARRSGSHFRRLYASWAIEKGQTRARMAPTTQNGATGQIRPSGMYQTAAEKTTSMLQREAIRAAKLDQEEVDRRNDEKRRVPTTDNNQAILGFFSNTGGERKPAGR